jgi:predicted transcriptional regulator
MNKDKKIWNFKATEEFISRLQKTADVLDRPASQLAREAINEKIDQLAQSNPKVAQALEEIAA